MRRKNPINAMGAREEGLACADPGARTTIGMSGSGCRDFVFGKGFLNTCLIAFWHNCILYLISFNESIDRLHCSVFMVLENINREGRSLLKQFVANLAQFCLNEGQRTHYPLDKIW